MKRAVLLTGHFPMQMRRASFHWISDHLQAAAWHVTHATVGYSWLSHLYGDARLRVLPEMPHQGAAVISPSLTGIFGLPPIHPVNFGNAFMNGLSAPFMGLFTRFWRTRLAEPLSRADLVICESGPPVVLGSLLAELAPEVPRIYRVNDDIRLLNAAPVVLRAEAAHKHFTRISTASPLLARRFQNHPNVTLDPMGVPAGLREMTPPSPYLRRSSPIAVCAGTSQLDVEALVRIAAAQPHWQVHVLGRLKSDPPRLPNITWHGEQEFGATVAHIAHADIGLAPYIDAPGVEYQSTNSNRILLYRHFGLPTLGPERLCTPEIPSIISDSAPDGPERCEAWGKQPEAIPDWSVLARRLSQNGLTEPPSDISISPDTISKLRVKTVPAFTSSA